MHEQFPSRKPNQETVEFLAPEQMAQQKELVSGLNIITNRQEIIQDSTAGEEVTTDTTSPSENIDLARQAVTDTYKDEGKTFTNGQGGLVEEEPQRFIRLNSAVEEARQKGIEEPKLKQLSQMLSSQRGPLERRIALLTIARRDGLDSTPDELMHIVRNYRKEVIRSTEKGALYHYHQTGMDNLESIIDSGALLPSKEQKRRGINRSAAGSRPDVVQMTRDRYSVDGKLLETGIKDTSAGLGAAGDIVFVFDESIMDDPDYDSIDIFPNVPKAPLSKLSKILVSDEKKVPHVQEVCASRGFEGEILTRADWLNRYGQRSSRSSY